MNDDRDRKEADGARQADAPAEASDAARESGWAIGDYLKRAVLAGVGAVFMTEEGVRSFLGELKLPKQTAQFVLSQVAKTKEDLFKLVASEVRGFLESTRLHEELKKVLTSISLEISTKVRFIDEGQRLKPDIEPRIRVVNETRRRRREAPGAEEAPPGEDREPGEPA